MYQDSETKLGALPLLLLTPILAAALAAFLATSQPPEVVRKGVVIGPSSFTNLVLAAVGGVGGVVVAAVGTFVLLLARYLLRGDSSWGAQNWGSRPGGATGPESFGTVMLTSKVTPWLSTILGGAAPQHDPAGFSGGSHLRSLTVLERSHKACLPSQRAPFPPIVDRRPAAASHGISQLCVEEQHQPTAFRAAVSSVPARASARGGSSHEAASARAHATGARHPRRGRPRPACRSAPRWSRANAWTVAPPRSGTRRSTRSRMPPLDDQRH